MNGKALSRCFARFAPWRRADGDNGQRVYNIQVAVGVFHHDIMPADENKLRTRHGILFAIRGADNGPLARRQMLADQVAIHSRLFA